MEGVWREDGGSVGKGWREFGGRIQAEEAAMVFATTVAMASLQIEGRSSDCFLVNIAGSFVLSGVLMQGI